MQHHQQPSSTTSSTTIINNIINKRAVLQLTLALQPIQLAL
jgi:hypothetical protein